MAAVIAGAPAASADVSNNYLTAAGTSHYTNQAYTLTADVHAVSMCLFVYFYDGTTPITPPGQDSPAVSPNNGAATLQWTPTTTGTHHISAIAMVINGQGPSLGPLDIQVTTAPTPGTGTGSADSIPVIGGILKSLGL
ncbi:hypothetical protein AB0I30_03125 [Nocardia tengchongensis]|uniref:hypothetical protein n=1 Tax=Nocardia tengchongensis TaxID=2055889 RepID=UPI0033D2BCA3